MQPRGTVEPPKKVKSGKQRKAAKDAAEKMVKATCLGSEWMVLGFRINPRTKDVELTYRVEDFPGDRFEEAAELFANAMVKLASAHPDVKAAVEAEARAALAAAQNSESASAPDAQPAPKEEPELPTILPL